MLPHESADLFLTDGGLETTLVFKEGFELPCFAAFDLLKDEKGYNSLQEYYRRYLAIAKVYKTGFILESPTWRANPDWIEKIGYPAAAISSINTKAIELLRDLKKEFTEHIDPIIISGCVGPRGDGYSIENKMTAGEAKEYHLQQVNIFSNAGVDMVSAITMNYAEEAIGICLAGNEVKLPVVISFTVETNGRLVTGMSLKEAIETIDSSVNTAPVYYMINCAHPTHFLNELDEDKKQHWVKRIRGIRANASCKSHAELDESTELDRGNPGQLGLEHKVLKQNLNQLNVFGGCCGTDEEHVKEIISILKPH
ncbi:MAG: homocysteine S-methyltransferase [Sphingobacteriales bacterium]|nr:MAG: homocysteine S-methyltransferase [Sphingobacteriales bacterium]